MWYSFFQYPFLWSAINDSDLNFSDLGDGDGVPYLYRGGGYYDNSIGVKYESRLFEHMVEETAAITPHVIMLGVQENTVGQNGQITLGELVLIITAMRTRAFEPSEEDGWDEEKDWVKRGNLLFKNERRFPVSFVFCIIFVIFSKLYEINISCLH